MMNYLVHGFYSMVLAVFLVWSSVAVSGPVVGIISGRDSAAYTRVIEACVSYLQEKAPGIAFQPVMLGKGSESTEKLKFLRDSNVDLVLVLGKRASLLASRYFSDRPLVMTMQLSLSEFESQSNVTGVPLTFSAASQLLMMRRILPDTKRIGILYDPIHNQTWLNSVKKIASEQGVSLQLIPVSSSKVLPAALKQLARSADALWAISDKTVYTKQTIKPILLASFRNRIPVIGLSNSWVKAGALYALTPDYQDLGQQSCDMVLQVLRGTDIAKIPHQFPRKTIYSLNLKTARHMKIDMANGVLKGAGNIYE